MPDELDYQCPHCQQTVHLDRSSIGGIVNCPKCGEQFQAQAPVARPVSRAEPPTASARSGSYEETVLLEVHPAMLRNHPILTLLFFLAGLAGLAALGFGLAGNPLLGLEGTALLITGGVLVLLSVGYFAYRKLQAISSTLRVTNQRTIMIRGILSQSTNEVQHEDVRNIRCDRNVWERIFNYGDLALSSAGQDDMEIVAPDIPDPQRIIEIIRKHQ